MGLTFCIWGLRVGRQTLSGQGRSGGGTRRRHVLRFRSGSHFHGLQQPHVNDGVVCCNSPLAPPSGSLSNYSSLGCNSLTAVAAVAPPTASFFENCKSHLTLCPRLYAHTAICTMLCFHEFFFWWNIFKLSMHWCELFFFTIK